MYPARFQLVGTMNLCPCGARGDPAVECSCSPQRLASFRDKLSRALLDRFDLVVTVPRPRAGELAAGPSEASAVVAERVDAARELLAVHSPRRTAEAEELLSRAVERLPLSGRGRARVARVARTVAALAGSEAVKPEHVAESLAYRSPRELEPCEEHEAGRGRARSRGVRRPRPAAMSFPSRATPGTRRFRRRFDAGAFRARLTAAGIRWLGRSDPAFPSSLRSIFDPPVGLFLRGGGDAELLERPAVAIVGARACSAYGSHVARTFGRELAAAGLVVVSGMARGVDGEAHRGALDAGGVTVAVLGCGVDRNYPAAHAELARRICGNGLVVSEYAPGVEPSPWRFPARNRIVAGSRPGDRRGRSA